ncbi:MAG: hypothetical protein WA117_24040 [Verrucomicrobiia bacterium]
MKTLPLWLQGVDEMARQRRVRVGPVGGGEAAVNLSRRKCLQIAVVIVALTLGSEQNCPGATPLLVQKLVINRPEFGSYVALWRISHDPVVDDHANYHSQQCWSHDGRYLTYRHCPVVADARSGQPYAGNARPTVHVYDLLKNEDRELGLGIVMMPGSCWANHHNWLFYVQIKEADRGFAANEGSPVIWVDMDTGKATKIGDGMDQLGGVDCNDEWVYGGIKDTARKPPFRVARIPIRSGGGTQELKESTGFQWATNPRHPMFMTRHDNWGQPFGATVWWWNLDGSNRRSGMMVLESAHMAWQGNGEHFLIGDGLARGRRWNEPAPSNVHVLAAGNVGNLSACGHSGRFAVGDSHMFDLRSGDTWQYKYFLSPPLKPAKQPYPGFDGEAKGSPDGTKVAFTVRYDMEKGLVTELTDVLRAGDQVLRVKSTEAFPPSGAVVAWCEVIAYERKTATTFEGLTRGLHDTLVNDGLGRGRAVTDLRHHLLTDAEWKNVKAVDLGLRQDVKDTNSPLFRQRGRDVYVMAVRRPDRPWLLPLRGAVQLIPGESHYETSGYHLAHNGRRFTTRPVRAGETLRLTPGQYSAVAVEWSGLESEPSAALNLTTPGVLQVLADAPKDFSWTRDRWLVNKTETPTAAVAMAAEAVREIVHLYDGVIAREWYRKGVLTQHHDLNHEGKAIRRLTYEAGKLATRDYYNRDGEHVTRELFAPDGFIIERIMMAKYGNTLGEADHWWFEKGTPVRRVAGRVETVKEGEKWTQK